jgi:hypothetical protein
MATLEELDAFGTMDSLDSFGTLEQLDNLVLHSASGAATIAATTSAAAIRIQQAAITTAATANFLINAAGAATISITESSAAIRIQNAVGTGTIAITTSAGYILILIPSFLDTNISLTADDCILSLRQDVSASESITISASVIGEILGETWTDIIPSTPSWSIQ